MGDRTPKQSVNPDHPTDGLEAFIAAHRSEFEQPFDIQTGWTDLEGRWTSSTQAPVRRLGLRRMRRLAAAAAVVVSLAAFARAYQVDDQNSRGLPQDMQEAQAYYEGEIHAEIVELQRHQDSDHPIDDRLLHSVEQRGTEYQMLVQALQENPGDANVHAAFVEYYRSRLALLHQLDASIPTQSSDQVHHQ